MTLDATQQARLDEIRARSDAATEGAWEHVGVEFRDTITHSVKCDDLVVSFVGYDSEGGRPDADAEFIAAAREDVPWLVALVTDLAAQVDTLTAERDAYRRAKAENDERFQIAAHDQRVRAEAAEAENATLRAQVEAVRALLDRLDRGGFFIRDDLHRVLDAASPTPHTPTKEHQ